MSTSILALIVNLRALGVRFEINGERLRVIVPKGVTLLPEVKHLVDIHWKEIHRRLLSGGLSPEDLQEVFPKSCDISPAVAWLRERLAKPARIAALIQEWEGPRQRPTGRTMPDLGASLAQPRRSAMLRG